MTPFIRLTLETPFAQSGYLEISFFGGGEARKITGHF